MGGWRLNRVVFSVSARWHKLILSRIIRSEPNHHFSINPFHTLH
jgi:hypothetical protein